MNNQSACENCSQITLNDDTYCSNCGFPQNGDNKEKAKFKYGVKLKKEALSEAEGKLKKVKIMLYILAGLNVAVGLFWLRSDFTFWDGISGLISGVVFIACAIWVNKQPLIGVLVAMIFYVLLQLSVVIVDPMLLLKGVILKVVVISIFIKGIQSAKDVKEFREKLAKG